MVFSRSVPLKRTLVRSAASSAAVYTINPGGRDEWNQMRLLGLQLGQSSKDSNKKTVSQVRRADVLSRGRQIDRYHHNRYDGRACCGDECFDRELVSPTSPLLQLLTKSSAAMQRLKSSLFRHQPLQ